MDGTPYNGKCETCHNNGLIERTVSFVNGKEDGIDTTTYQTVCIQVIRAHIQGVRNGQWIYYYYLCSRYANEKYNSKPSGYMLSWNLF